MDLHNTAYRIMSGELLINVDNQLYKLVSPDPRTKYEAEKIYNKTMYENRFGDFLTDRQVLILLTKNDLCSPQIDRNLKEIETRVEDIKIDIYESMVSFRADHIEKHRDLLKKVRAKQTSMINNRHMFDHLTLKGFAEMAKRQFLIYSTLCYPNDELVWKNIDDIDIDTLEKVVVAANESIISPGEIRQVARNDPWRSYWNINKGNPFDKPPIMLSEEQRVLILFTKMYDSAYEHPECPPDNIIEDDDAFDGWMSFEKRKREKEVTSQNLDKRIQGKMGNADEVFIPVGSIDEAKKINRLNDISARMKKRSREKVIKAKGTVADAQFPDRKLQIQMQAVNQQAEAARGRK